MQPALSVLFLTTLIGAGQGLFIALYLAELWGHVGWTPQPQPSFLALGAAAALVLTGLGLLSSFFHLGRPERAWRSATRWRTSWLSREVIVLPLFMAALFVYALAHASGWSAGRPFAMLALGAVGAVLALALYVCTGMIYACLRFLQEWASPLTVINYLLLGLASGFMLAAALAALAAPALLLFYGGGALLATAAAFVGRVASLLRNARLKPKSSLQTAIGVRHPRIVQISQGFMGGSFNTREFFHGRPRAFFRSIKWIFLVLAFPLPAALLALGLAADLPLLPALAFVVQYVGLLAERWFFFAQANHPQNLYYQAVA
ncbi:MAG: dimethyl sulfoxide reductase anchor subunit [Burkholderiales bacterium]|jgi:DMSO reductase anchor subunit|nr:dimethyl sulfoxide reductase anchor subunit [Burkholderiales bacterium]